MHLALGRCRYWRVLDQCRIEQTVRVIEGRTKNLPTRYILESGRNAAACPHLRCVERFCRTEPWQGGAVCTQQEYRFDHVAPRLLDGKRSKLAIIQRPFRHHAIDSQRKLFGDLRQREIWHPWITATLMRQKPVCIFNCALATLHRNVHA